MTRHQVKLLDQPIEHYSSSTVLVGKRDGRELNWGHMSGNGNSYRIVVLKIGELIEITVHEELIGAARIRGLRDHFHSNYGPKKAKATETALSVEVDARRRREAAEAAIDAADYKLACEIDAGALFDAIAHAIIEHYAKHMSSNWLLGLLSDVQKTLESETRYAFERGRNDAKAELLDWLGTGSSRFGNP